ncbi:hypothetical protein L596_014364 [Steinernema carpocapsae]|uniref:Uncharacterized protein n=1 Tax=Steinernema carpocapsae TaxID=34508 RepID=A0A4U5NCM7_STECR|nr:hypothetical protein L596_014364 [Steinernema carpocapsae]
MNHSRRCLFDVAVNSIWPESALKEESLPDEETASASELSSRLAWERSRRIVRDFLQNRRGCFARVLSQICERFPHPVQPKRARSHRGCGTARSVHRRMIHPVLRLL